MLTSCRGPQSQDKESCHVCVKGQTPATLLPCSPSPTSLPPTHLLFPTLQSNQGALLFTPLLWSIPHRMKAKFLGKITTPFRSGPCPPVQPRLRLLSCLHPFSSHTRVLWVSSPGLTPRCGLCLNALLLPLRLAETYRSSPVQRQVPSPLNLPSLRHHVCPSALRPQTPSAKPLTSGQGR